MIELPRFDDAIRGLQELLDTAGHPSQLAWARCRDYYSIGPGQHRVLWPLPANRTRVESNYEKARARGLAGLEAIFYVGQVSVVILDAPEADEIQGWSHGLKLCIRQPFVAAEPIPSGPTWDRHRRSKEYRWFHTL